MTFQELMNCYALSSNENNRITYNELLSQFRGQNVTPVIGAGLSTWAYPRWNELLKEQASTIGLQSEIETMLNNNQYEEAASLLEKELTYYGFLRVLQNVFDPSLTEEKADQCPEYSKLLPHIFRGPVVTTNFDRVIEYLFRVENVGHPDTVTPQDVFQGQQMDHAIHENSSILVKMHGDIQAPEHMVLTKQSYDETYGSDALNPDLTKPMPAFLRKFWSAIPFCSSAVA